MKLKNIIRVIVIFSVFLIGVNFVNSAPAPHGIAINEAEKTCANYWMGDEFSQQPLPSGWKDYYPKRVVDDIDTSLGLCEFNSYDVFTADKMTSDLQNCLDSIGCVYVSYEGFNKSFSDFLGNEFSCSPPAFKKGTWERKSLAIDINKKQCTLMTCTRNIGTYNDSYVKYPNGLEIYAEPNQYTVVLNTEAGDCKIHPTSSDYSECCEQLGYAYLEKIPNLPKSYKSKLPDPTDRSRDLELNSNLIILLMLFITALMTLGVILYKGRKNKKKKP